MPGLVPASKKALDWIPFEPALLSAKPEDAWLVVSKDGPASSIGLEPRASWICAADLDRLAEGSAGHLFPFLFHSRYLRLAELDSNLDLNRPISEQLLFRLIQAGAGPFIEAHLT